jgi:hypothetical protein
MFAPTWAAILLYHERLCDGRGQGALIEHEGMQENLAREYCMSYKYDGTPSWQHPYHDPVLPRQLLAPPKLAYPVHPSLVPPATFAFDLSVYPQACP